MRKGFTLIELLIVVAIIAILAAIAVPNFLEAQVRSKVSRTKADIRTMATALEAYAVDFNSVPNCHRFGIVLTNLDGGPPILERLSTPVAYVTNTLAKDPFTIKGRFQSAAASAMQTEVPTSSPPGDSVILYNSYIYQSWNDDQRYTQPPDSFSVANLDTKSRAWLMHSAGPDGYYYNLGGVLANDGVEEMANCTHLIYDSTNGTISRGSIFRVGGNAVSGKRNADAGYKAGSGLIAAIRTQK